MMERTQGFANAGMMGMFFPGCSDTFRNVRMRKIKRKNWEEDNDGKDKKKRNKKKNKKKKYE